MIETAVMVGLALATLALSFAAGRWTGKNAYLYSLEVDVQARRFLLEKLAKLENARIVGRE